MTSFFKKKQNNQVTFLTSTKIYAQVHINYIHTWKDLAVAHKNYFAAVVQIVHEVDTFQDQIHAHHNFSEFQACKYFHYFDWRNPILQVVSDYKTVPLAVVVIVAVDNMQPI